MTERELPNFDDPELKAALRHALGSECASAALRSRVEELFGLEDAPIPIRPMWRHPLLGLAAAMLVFIGLAGWLVESNRPAAVVADQTVDHLAALPVSFAADLVATHDHCCSMPDHHVLKGVADDDFRLMTQKLREKLGFPVLAATAGEGWKFYGASAFCKVGGVPSAHLVFKQGDQSLSIFSVALASESWPAGQPSEGERFSNMQAGHAILSWVHDGAVFSVVGYRSGGLMEPANIAPITDRMRVAIGGGDDDDAGRETVAKAE
jgi:hypothetical protein